MLTTAYTLFAEGGTKKQKNKINHSRIVFCRVASDAQGRQRDSDSDNSNIGINKRKHDSASSITNIHNNYTHACIRNVLAKYAEREGRENWQLSLPPIALLNLITI